MFRETLFAGTILAGTLAAPSIGEPIIIDSFAGGGGASTGIEMALGHGRRECLPAEAMNLIVSRRALHATRALAAGQAIERGDIAALRPSCGLPPTAEDALVGLVLARNVERGAPFVNEDLGSARRTRDVA